MPPALTLSRSVPLPPSVHCTDKYEAIQHWLMDPDACPTKWPALLKIRKENKNYKIGAGDGSPSGSK